jgi:hypothetical protein
MNRREEKDRTGEVKRKVEKRGRGKGADSLSLFPFSRSLFLSLFSLFLSLFLIFTLLWHREKKEGRQGPSEVRVRKGRGK